MEVIRLGNNINERDQAVLDALDENIKIAPSIGVCADTFYALKQEFLLAVFDKLRSNSPEEEDYILHYLFRSLKPLASQMPSHIESIIRARLKKGDKRFYDAMILRCPWDAKTYTLELAKAIEEFREAEASFTDFDDDIPF